MRELLMENTARQDLTVRSNPRVEFRKDSRQVHGFATSHRAETHFPWGLQFSFHPLTFCHDTVLHLRSRYLGIVFCATGLISVYMSWSKDV